MEKCDLTIRIPQSSFQVLYKFCLIKNYLTNSNGSELAQNRDHLIILGEVFVFLTHKLTLIIHPFHIFIPGIALTEWSFKINAEDTYPLINPVK